MKRAASWLAAWIGLFSAFYAVANHLHADDVATNSAEKPLIIEGFLTRRVELPADRLRECRPLVRAGRELDGVTIQFSFDVVREAQGGSAPLRMRHVRVTKGSAWVAPEARRCIESALDGTKVDLPAPPDGRVHHAFCFSWGPAGPNENSATPIPEGDDHE